MLELKNVSKQYQRGSQTIHALRSLNLTVQQGEFIHVIGKSGSGKSTLLSLVAGLLHPTEGQILYQSVAFSDLSEDERALFRNQNFGIVPQSSTLLPALTVLENVILPWYLQKREGDSDGRARYLLDKLGIRNLETAYPRMLSGGELRRVLIARALMCDPQFILADEPTSDLDQENTEAVLNLFRNIHAEGKTLMVVTHELDTLAYGQRILTLKDGVFVDHQSEKCC